MKYYNDPLLMTFFKSLYLNSFCSSRKTIPPTMEFNLLDVTIIILTLCALALIWVKEIRIVLFLAWSVFLLDGAYIEFLLLNCFLFVFKHFYNEVSLDPILDLKYQFLSTNPILDGSVALILKAGWNWSLIASFTKHS